MYVDIVEGFAMPLRVHINGKEVTLKPRAERQNLAFPESISSFEVDRNFMVVAKSDDQSTGDAK